MMTAFRGRDNDTSKRVLDELKAINAFGWETIIK